MTEDKLCPLKFTVSFKDKHDSVGWNCDEENCAWWNQGAGKCVILVISEFCIKGFQGADKEKVELSIAEKEILGGLEGTGGKE